MELSHLAAQHRSLAPAAPLILKWGKFAKQKSAFARSAVDSSSIRNLLAASSTCDGPSTEARKTNQFWSTWKNLMSVEPVRLATPKWKPTIIADRAISFSTLATAVNSRGSTTANYPKSHAHPAGDKCIGQRVTERRLRTIPYPSQSSLRQSVSQTPALSSSALPHAFSAKPLSR